MENEKINEILINETKNILNKAGFEADVDVFENNIKGDNLKIVSLRSNGDISILIGKNGQNIKYFEHLLKKFFFKKNPGLDASFILDINDYRKSRTDFIIDQAKLAVSRVRTTKKAEAMFPMSSYERRVIHMELATFPDIETESVGEEPKRRIIVKPLF